MENKTTEKRNRVQTYSGLGKLPPQAPDLEEAVLGVMMLERCNNIQVWALMRPEIFYRENNKKICAAIRRLKDAGNPIDLMTVRAELSRMGELEMIGGAYYLTELTDRVASNQNTEFHLRIIYEKFMRRELIHIGTSMVQSGYEDTVDPFGLISSSLTEIDTIGRGLFKNTEKHASVLVEEVRAKMAEPKKGGIIGTTTGFRGIDAICEGDQKGQFIIDAGRPGMGKSALAGAMVIQNGYEDKIPVGVFSLEMPGVQLTFRNLSSISSIPANKIKKNFLNTDEREHFNWIANKYAEAPIYIDDTPGLNIVEFETKAAMWVSMYGVQKIYLDYLQLMAGDPNKNYRGNRDAELSEVSRRLKACANNLGVTISALCQLNREVEKRPMCLPILSDLRETGSFEQDADIVRFLWRPEYYDDIVAKWDKDPEKSAITAKKFGGLRITDHAGLVMSIVAKCRDEGGAKVPLLFKGATMNLKDHPGVIEYLENNKREDVITTEERPVAF